ncbi:MAG: A/G-specific adenine glycosylase [Bacteroidales bacterium]|nr:A/G-specific adenine glycosylase [Bacteroidales bacterium]
MNVSELIGEWYDRNKRNLAWREEGLPYQIWISEIILQQTRVNQGTPYYFRFIRQFPDIKTLADAPVNEVLHCWQGLGYYTRARNLHKAARIIMEEYNGKFPEEYRVIRKLPGIGDYTAAAIASLAFGEAWAAVDGNVYRVLARYLGITDPINTGPGKKVFLQAANDLLDRKDPGKHNQAMIELGALICLPRNPACDVCPLQASCHARQKNAMGDLPVKVKKPKPSHRYFTYLVVAMGDVIFLRQRAVGDIWALLYDFPLIETETEEPIGKLLSGKFWESTFTGCEAVIISSAREYRHILSHRILHTRFIRIEVRKPISYPGVIQVKRTDIKAFPFPELISRYLKEEKLLTISQQS